MPAAHLGHTEGGVVDGKFDHHQVCALRSSTRGGLRQALPVWQPWHAAQVMQPALQAPRRGGGGGGGGGAALASGTRRSRQGSICIEWEGRRERRWQADTVKARRLHTCTATASHTDMQQVCSVHLCGAPAGHATVVQSVAPAPQGRHGDGGMAGQGAEE